MRERGDGRAVEKMERNGDRRERKRQILHVARRPSPSMHATSFHHLRRGLLLDEG